MFCFGTIVELEYTEWLFGMMFFVFVFVFVFFKYLFSFWN